MKPLAVAACVMSALVTHPKNYPELDARLEAALGVRPVGPNVKHASSQELKLRESLIKRVTSAPLPAQQS